MNVSIIHSLKTDSNLSNFWVVLSHVQNAEYDDFEDILAASYD